MDDLLHIVFGETAKSSLGQSFILDQEYEGDIICLNDDLSIGPINNLTAASGIMTRRELWDKITHGTIYNEWKLKEIDLAVESDKFKVLKANVDKQVFCIWMGPDTVSRIGFMRLMYELKDTETKMLVMDYPFKTYDYPGDHKLFLGIRTLGAEQIAGMKKYIRNIESTEKDIAIANWLEISTNSSSLRIVDNKEIRHVPESYYDELLLSYCGTEFSKAAFVIGHTVGELNFTLKWVWDVYLNWRLKELVKSDRLMSQGSLTDIRDYKVKLNVALPL